MSAESRRGGVRHMIAAAFFFSLMSLIVKTLGSGMPTAQVVFARSVVMFALAFVMVRRAGVSMWGNRKGLLVLRALSGFAALFCFFYAVPRLPLADVTVLHFTNPVFTAILAALVLGESMGWREVAGMVTSFAGVVLIARPAFLFGGLAGALDPTAVAAALAGSVFSSVAYTTVRKLRESDHHLVVVFYFTLISVPASIPLMAGGVVRPDVLQWVLLAAVGVVTMTAQVFLTKGLHRERAGRAMSISYIQVVFAAVWGFVFFQEHPDIFRLFGAALVFAGTLLVATGRATAAPEPVGGIARACTARLNAPSGRGRGR